MFRLSLIVLLFSVCCLSQNLTVPKGEIVDSLAIPQFDETYAIYLPESYEPDKPSSVIFVFEPMGRARIGVGVFTVAAEKFDHIIVSSNNAKNFNDKNFEVAEHLMNHIFETYTIDKNLVYTAGFSGGARLALAIAVLSNVVEGVVACGAGLSPNPGHVPNASNHFSWVGLVGSKDMNYHELFRTSKFLHMVGIENRIFTNEDPHKWPDPNQIDKAMSWLELEAYKKSRKKVDPLLVRSYYKLLYDEAKLFEEHNNIDEAVLGYQMILRDFSRYLTTDSITQKLTHLKSTKEYKKGTNKRAAIEAEEVRVKTVFFTRFQKEFKKNKLPKNYNWWEKELKKFKKEYLNSQNSARKGIGIRVQNMLYALAIETATVEMKKNQMTKVIYCHSLLSVLYPERPFSFCLLANDYALLKDESNMLAAIEKAIDNGLKTKEYFETTASFSQFRDNENFKNLLQQIEHP